MSAKFHSPASTLPPNFKRTSRSSSPSGRRWRALAPDEGRAVVHQRRMLSRRTNKRLFGESPPLARRGVIPSEAEGSHATNIRMPEPVTLSTTNRRQRVRFQAEWDGLQATLSLRENRTRYAHTSGMRSLGFARDDITRRDRLHSAKPRRRLIRRFLARQT